MLNQSLRRLQEVCRKLARHALLLNPVQSRLARSRRFYGCDGQNAMRCSSKLFRVQFCHPARASSVWALACNHSDRALLLFTLGTGTEKLHSGPSVMNDNPDRLIPNMSVTLQFPGRLEAAASKKVRPASKWVLPAWSDP